MTVGFCTLLLLELYVVDCCECIAPVTLFCALQEAKAMKGFKNALKEVRRINSDPSIPFWVRSSCVMEPWLELGFHRGNLHGTLELGCSPHMGWPEADA